MARREDEELMAYLDGELAPRDARSVEERLGASTHDQRKAEALKQLSTVIRGHYEAATAEVEPQLASLWAKLEAQMSSPAAPKRAGLVSALGGLWDSYRSQVLVGAVCAAAGAVLALSIARPEPEIRERIVEVEVPVPAPATAVVARAENAEVEQLDVVGGSGTVFQIPAEKEGEAATTVIWVTRDDAKPEGPI